MHIGNANPSGTGTNGYIYSPDGVAPSVLTNHGEGSKIAFIETRSGSTSETHNSLTTLKGRQGSILEKRVYDDKNNHLREDDCSGAMTQSFSHSAPRNGCKLIDGMRIRRLTPLECERLQGFPDGYTAQGITPEGKTIRISDSQRYRCLGNAVTVNVIETIMRRLYRAD